MALETLFLSFAGPDRTWAEWVAFVSGTLLLPFEVRELFRGVTFLRCGLLVGNLAIVFYMLYVILENRRERRLSTGDV